MKNKGYTIMEAVIAMFLVLVMVGAVFSALMAGRRAIATSSEKEEVFYTLQSAYGMLKDCRENQAACHLQKLGCYTNPFSGNWKTCSNLFTFNFKSVCKNEDNENSKFQYDITSVDGDTLDWICAGIEGCSLNEDAIYKYYTVDIKATCQEEDE